MQDMLLKDKLFPWICHNYQVEKYSSDISMYLLVTGTTQGKNGDWEVKIKIQNAKISSWIVNSLGALGF